MRSGLLLIGIVLIWSLSGRADPLDRWEYRGSWPIAGAIEEIVFADGTFIAVGEEGTIITSTDGRQWRAEDSGTETLLHGVCRGNGLYVAVGFQTILTSNDGRSWTQQYTDHYLRRVAYGNGIFVAVGFAGVIMTSSNGVDWVQQSAGPISNLSDVHFAAGKFFAVGLPGIISSADGVVWTSDYTNITSLRRITDGNGMLVAVGQNKTPVWSEDGGVTWETGSTGTNNLNLSGVAYGDNGFVAVSQQGVILRSQDGKVWEAGAAVASPWDMFAVVFANGIYIAAGGSTSASMWTSGDATEWRRLDETASYEGVAFGNGLHVLVGVASNVWTSIDGSAWTPQGFGQRKVLYDVAYGDGKFVAVGFNGAVVRSEDGTDWSVGSPGTNIWLFGVTYGRSNFVAAARSGSIFTSKDGSAWQPHSTPSTRDLKAVSWTGQEFIVASEDAEILRSLDAINWTTRRAYTNSATNMIDISGIAHGNGRYVGVGRHLEFIFDYVIMRPAILSSANGNTWTTQILDWNGELNDVTHAHGIFVAVGSGGKILTSADGMEWTTRSSGILRDLTAVSYAKGRFMAVGSLNAILESGYWGPPVFTHAVMTPAGFELAIGAGPGQACRIQFSERIGPAQWHDLHAFTSVEVPTAFTDSGANNSGQRFYRVISP